MGGRNLHQLIVDDRGSCRLLRYLSCSGRFPQMPLTTTTTPRPNRACIRKLGYRMPYRRSTWYRTAATSGLASNHNCATTIQPTSLIADAVRPAAGAAGPHLRSGLQTPSDPGNASPLGPAPRASPARLAPRPTQAQPAQTTTGRPVAELSAAADQASRDRPLNRFRKSRVLRRLTAETRRAAGQAGPWREAEAARATPGLGLWAAGLDQQACARSSNWPPSTTHIPTVTGGVSRCA